MPRFNVLKAFTGSRNRSAADRPPGNSSSSVNTDVYSVIPARTPGLRKSYPSIQPENIVGIDTRPVNLDHEYINQDWHPHPYSRRATVEYESEDDPSEMPRRRRSLSADIPHVLEPVAESDGSVPSVLREDQPSRLHEVFSDDGDDHAHRIAHSVSGTTESSSHSWRQQPSTGRMSAIAQPCNHSRDAVNTTMMRSSRVGSSHADPPNDDNLSYEARPRQVDISPQPSFVPRSDFSRVSGNLMQPRAVSSRYGYSAYESRPPQMELGVPRETPYINSSEPTQSSAYGHHHHSNSEQIVSNSAQNTYYIVPSGVNVIFRDEQGNEITRVGDFRPNRPRYKHTPLIVQDEYGRELYRSSDFSYSATSRSRSAGGFYDHDKEMARYKFHYPVPLSSSSRTESEASYEPGQGPKIILIDYDGRQIPISPVRPVVAPRVSYISRRMGLYH